MKQILLCCMLLISVSLSAQKLTVKTNLLYDATATVNLGVEVGLAPKWTFDLSGNYNGWTFSNNRKWKHWLAQPELRYWFCERFNGHFLGFHLVGGIYNIGNIDADFKLFDTDFGSLKDHRYEGWMVGGGMGYGYQWLLSKHWSLEAEIGLGYIYTRTDKYECVHCGEKLKDDEPHHYIGPTKVALSVIYAF